MAVGKMPLYYKFKFDWRHILEVI